MYKMVDISKKAYENNDIEVIVDGISTKAHRRKIRSYNLPVITNKYDPVYKKHGYELVNRPKKQLNRRF